MGDVISGVLAIGGASFMLLAAIGMLRFPDIYSRMHAATKASTLGILLIVFSGLIAVEQDRFKLVLVILLIFITAPAASHLVSRSSYRAERIVLHLNARDDLAASLEPPENPDDH